MHCIDLIAPPIPLRPSNPWRATRWLCLAGLLALGACGTTPSSSASSAPRSRERALLNLPEPAPVHSPAALRLQAARRIVQANPGGTYSGVPPEVLLAVPVLEVEVNADGSIRRIEVLRRPSQAPETTQLAIDAVRRAAPFGDASSLPKPRKFIETFLFDEDKRFMPRTLSR